MLKRPKKTLASDSGDGPHIPVRMCVICRQRFEKPMLTRYVMGADGLPEEDITGKMPGRGYYCCPAQKCRKRLECWKPSKRMRKKAGVTGR